MQLLLQAAVLGIIQGLTEFLPVSSSAHLILVREVLGLKLLDDPHWNMIFDVSAHAGTFMALLLYFWGDIKRLLVAFAMSLRWGIAGEVERRVAWVLLLATIPAALAGTLGEGAIERVFRQLPVLLATLLICFGLLLWVADRRGRKVRDLAEIGWLDGILIGIAQALALAPGVSRSGVTMTVGLGRGMTREAAARFSFLLSIPSVAGAAVYGAKDVTESISKLPEGSVASFAVGLLAAGISGYLCIRYFLRYLQRHALAPFVVYRVALGVFLLLWLVAGRTWPTEAPPARKWRPLRGELGGRRYVRVLGGSRVTKEPPKAAGRDHSQAGRARRGLG